MRYLLRLASLFFGALLLVSGCDVEGTNEPVSSMSRTEAVGETPEDAGGCVTIGGYEICLTESEFDGTHTTFVYTVSPAGAGAHLWHLVIGYETCDPLLEVIAMNPSGEAGTDDAVTGVFGVFYDSMQRKNEVKQYAITFAGEVATGVTQVGLQVGSEIASAWVAGPACEAVTYDISGTVYIESDARESPQFGTREGGEAGIADITVVLTYVDGNPVLDASDMPYQDVTDHNGVFSFEGLSAGTYHVIVPSSTTDPDGNNETLYLVEANSPLYEFASADALSLPSGLAAVAVSLGPDAQVDLGFAPDTDVVVAALGGSLATRNVLPFQHFLPLIAGLSKPEDLSKGSLPSYGVTVGDYVLRFLGRSYDSSMDRTTYAYEIDRKGGKGNDVSHVTFGVDGCTPVAYDPARIQFGFDPTTQVDGAKFDFGVKKKQTYLLHFAGDVHPGVIDVGVKYGTATAVVPMPGACAGSIGSVTDLLRSLDNAYYGGPSDPNYLFLQDPLLLPPGKSELAAAIELLSKKDLEVNGLEYLEQYLLVALIIFDRGLGTPNYAFDVTLFQFVEPIIFFVSQQGAGKSGGILAGTGGSGAGGSVLGSYAR